jgi:hypothetical protein
MLNRFSNILRVAMILTFASACALQVFGQNVTRTLTITRDAKLAGQPVSQGKYTIKFDEQKDGEAEITKGGREAFKAPYKITTLSKNAADSAVIFTKAEDGSLKVRRIEMKGSKIALQFE